MIGKLTVFLLFLSLVPSLLAQETKKSLLITDTSVVEKLFPFSKIIETLTNDKDQFIKNWIKQWKRSELNGYRLTPRDSNQILRKWPKKQDGSFDFSKAPFRLLAIVNRMDLKSQKDPYGEFRLVYCFYDPVTLNPEEFTVIFEFKIPRTPNRNYAYWKKQFKDLSSLDFGVDFNLKLNSIYNQIVSKKGLNQVRTNDFYLDFKWELREFRLNNGFLKQTITAQTPDLTHNTSSEFQTWIGNNQVRIKNMDYIIPDKFLGASSVMDSEEFRWDFDLQFPEIIRKNLSVNTCNGCHGGETQTEFTHIKPRRRGVNSYISHFLHGELSDRKKTIFIKPYNGNALPRKPTRVH